LAGKEDSFELLKHLKSYIGLMIHMIKDLTKIKNEGYKDASQLSEIEFIYN
jgi:hypothetical protein